MARQRHEDTPAPDPEPTTPARLPTERGAEASLRPLTFEDYIGQQDLSAP